MGYNKSFIEVQFPVSKISKESYKERKANLGQTLTGLGKWWGRKPLILVRATLLGCLMPSSNNHKRDMEIFLKILTMDSNGLLERKIKNISLKVIYTVLCEEEKKKYFDEDSTLENLKLVKNISREEKEKLQNIAFSRLTYDEKITYCIRPEQINETKKEYWNEINEYLGTNSTNIQELIQELGEKMYGNVPKVGDCFSGGGSIPFECARSGADVYASDLNPVATLLTWADLNIAGGHDSEINSLRMFQENVYNEVTRQVLKWEIEVNESGDRAEMYLYCNEVICPECGYKVPLAPSWIIGQGTKTVALLEENEYSGFDIRIIQNATKDIMKESQSKITIKKNNMYCPHCKNETPISALRKDHKDLNGNTIYGLRKWSINEYIANENDIFHERLYCIRYIRNINIQNGRAERYYTEPTKEDIRREVEVIKLLSDRFEEWQQKGYIPNSKIEGGYNTDQPIRERGWQYWHQLFNPRQLLLNGLFNKTIQELALSQKELAIGVLGLNKLVDWNSKLCIWNVGAGVETSQNTYTNQALNTLYNYGSRGLLKYYKNWTMNISNTRMMSKLSVEVKDARDVTRINDIWITDPPYADAINYHELSEFFLAWDKKLINKGFNEWYCDSKRVLAVKGTGDEFKESMVEIYSNLTKHMNDEGMQIIMFTHQDVKVWAELTGIIWRAGLQVTSAWNIATETESGGLKDGNYVKGTVILVLRKQSSDHIAYLDEVYPEIEVEVKNQIDTMRELDDKEDPNFSDTDYLLAAYAASLKVLTSYNIKYEKEEEIEILISEAKKIAYDYLIPSGFNDYLWKQLNSVERFYLKGLEFEINNTCKLSGYQELAKGFGVNEYDWMLGSTKANSARVKTPKEFAMRTINDNSVFGQSLVRHALAAIYISLKEDNSNKGLSWLKSEIAQYWNSRSVLIEILSYLSKTEAIDSMEHWKQCGHEAFILKTLVENDSI